MDLLFGDATTAMPTPAQHAEVESLMSGARSPVPSLDLRRGGGPGQFTADSAIPGLDINPPSNPVENGKSHPPPEAPSSNGGLGSWLARMTQRTTGKSKQNGGSGYGRLGQDDD